MGLGGRFDKADFDERTFRYSVKCDRDTFRRIEAAAKQAGVPATSFVQKHFETILDMPPDDTGFAVGPFARDHGISEQAARMWHSMRRNADAADVVSGSVRDLATQAKVSAGHGSDYLAELMTAGLVRMIARAGNGRPGSYRVAWLP